MVVSPKDVNFFLRKRYFVTAWCFMGMVILFVLRVNLSICIVDMTSKKNITFENTTYVQEAEYSWTSSTKGLLLSSFSWGYLTTPLTFIFIRKIGAGNAFNCAILVTGVLTVLSPLLIQSGIYIYIFGRFLEGLLEGLANTALYGIFAVWIPSNERSRLINFSCLGRMTGVMIGYPICGYISYVLNWKYVFYITGASTILWSLVWSLTICNSPSEDLLITHLEKEYLQTVNEPALKKCSHTPWISMLKSAPVLALLNEIFVQSWSISFLMYCFPLFIKDLHDVSMDKIGILSMFPEIAGLSSRLIMSFYQDHLRNKGTMSKTKIHKIYILFGQISGIVLLILSGLMNDFYSSLIILCLFKFCFSVAEVSYVVIAVDMAPQYSAQIDALTTPSTSVGYLLNPLVMGFLVANKTHAEWNHYIWFLSIFNIWGLVIFSLYGSAETPAWASNDCSTPA